MLPLVAFLAATTLGWITASNDQTKLAITAAILDLIVVLADMLLKISERRAKPDEAVDPLAPAPEQRKIMLNQVEQQWIKSVLERPIHDSVMEMLDLSYIDSPISSGVRYSLDGQDRFIQSDADAMDIFNSVGQGHGLLILGEPGAGKTTTMLQLAREQIRQARENVDEPLPIVFTLSSWTPEFKRLADWLADELKIHYGVRHEIGRQWIEGQHLILLLDGLDEVREDRRDDCVRAINRFREDEDHGLTRTIVCCRSQAYGDLEEELSSLSGLITIQPLTDAQVSDFLSREDLELGAVQACLDDDAVLRELITSPLNLSVMAVAYAGKLPEDLRVLDTDARRKDLFDEYIVRIFAHSRRKLPAKGNEKKTHFAPGDTLRWLAYLARQMNAHGLTRFLIERLQPTWLEGQAQKLQFLRRSNLVLGLVEGLGFGLVGGLGGGLIFGLVGGLVVWLVVMLLSGLSSRSGEAGYIQTVDRITLSWGRLVSGLSSGLVSGLGFGLVGGLVFGLFCGLFVGLSFGLVFGLFFGLVLGLFVGLGVVLSIGLFDGLAEGLSPEQIDVSARPNHGMRRTLGNAARSGFIGGLTGGLLFALLLGTRIASLGEGMVPLSGQDTITWSWYGFRRGLTIGATIGPLVGLAVGMAYGGKDVFKHYLLRRLLARAGHFPKTRELVPFLGYADDLIFIRRTGGSYRFIHSLVQEHFANLTPEDIRRLSDAIHQSGTH